MNEKNKSKKGRLGIILVAIIVASVFAAFAPTASAVGDATSTPDPKCIKICTPTDVTLTVKNTVGSTANITDIRFDVPMKAGDVRFRLEGTIDIPPCWDYVNNGFDLHGRIKWVEYAVKGTACEIAPGANGIFVFHDMHAPTGLVDQCTPYEWKVNVSFKDSSHDYANFTLRADAVAPSVTANPTGYDECTQAKGCQNVTLNVTAIDDCTDCCPPCGISEVIVEDTAHITDYDMITMTLKDNCRYTNGTVHIKKTAATGVYNLPVTATDCAGDRRSQD